MENSKSPKFCYTLLHAAISIMYSTKPRFSLCYKIIIQVEINNNTHERLQLLFFLLFAQNQVRLSLSDYARINLTNFQNTTTSRQSNTHTHTPSLSLSLSLLSSKRMQNIINTSTTTRTRKRSEYGGRRTKSTEQTQSPVLS